MWVRNSFASLWDEGSPGHAMKWAWFENKSITVHMTVFPLLSRSSMINSIAIEKESDTLPPHRPMDCAIEIVPRAKLPKPKMYSMAPRELELLQAFIDKNLAWGFIQLAK